MSLVNVTSAKVSDRCGGVGGCEEALAPTSPHVNPADAASTRLILLSIDIVQTPEELERKPVNYTRADITGTASAAAVAGRLHLSVTGSKQDDGGLTMRDKPGEQDQRDTEQQNKYVQGGKGRKDEVGRSGIYPASSPDAPPDAAIRTEGELAGKTRRRQPVESEGDAENLDRESGTD
jgi:hypothetical protein